MFRFVRNKTAGLRGVGLRLGSFLVGVLIGLGLWWVGDFHFMLDICYAVEATVVSTGAVAAGSVTTGSVVLGSAAVSTGAVASGSAAADSSRASTSYFGRKSFSITSDSSRVKANFPEPSEVNTYFYHYDHLGGTAVTTDENGQIVELVDYDPFGVNTIYQKPQGDVYTGEYFYTGQEWDMWTRLYYYGARYYFNEIGKFYSVDPALFWLGNEEFLKQKTGMGLQAFLADPQLLNSYAYARNNPVKYVDPTGEFVVGIASMLLNELERSIWRFAIEKVCYGEAGLKITGDMLMHSLQNDPPVFVAENDSYMVEQIKSSVEYRSELETIEEKILQGNLEGGGGIIFNGKDLFTSLHITDYSYSAKLSEQGDWDIDIQITDIYDFHFIDAGEYNDAFMDSVNNAAYLDQSVGAINEYEVIINVKECIKVDSEK